MTTETPQTSASTADHPGDAVAAAPARLTTGIVSLALGLTAVDGGGILSSAVTLWTFEFSGGSDPISQERLFEAITILPGLLVAAVALILGLFAAQSRHPLAAAVGKAGAVLGGLALLAAVAYAVTVYSSRGF